MRKAFSAVAFILISLATGAQTTFGLKIGANIAHLKSSVSGPAINLDSRLGFHGGFFFTIPSAKNFSIQPELVYSMEGAEYAQTNRGITLHCINLPVMFQYNTSGFIVEAGPQIGFLVSAKENGRDATDGYENVNIALGMGAAYRMKQGFGINARYNLGLTGITKNDSQDAKLTSNVIQLGFTFSVANIKRRK